MKPFNLPLNHLQGPDGASRTVSSSRGYNCEGCLSTLLLIEFQRRSSVIYKGPRVSFSESSLP